MIDRQRSWRELSRLSHFAIDDDDDGDSSSSCTWQTLISVFFRHATKTEPRCFERCGASLIATTHAGDVRDTRAC
jgi:hypothetical protein